MLSITDVLIERCRLVFLDTYNRTTSWQYSGNEPRVARVVYSSQSSVHIRAQSLTAFLALLSLLFVTGPRPLHFHCI